MKKFLMRGLLAFITLFSATGVVKAQDMSQIPPLPQDSALIIGHLDNGLTYYIRHNETPKGQADFYIAQKVGSILEEENQRGLAHFLEHMCFNGTTNFPEKGIINWLESVGVKFGYNLNAYTGMEQTVYNISNVPVARQSVQDSCLLILHDWSCDLTLDPKEIDAERGVIHEEWRRSMVGSMRIFEQLGPKIYDGDRYGERLPIGIMEVVDNFEPKALVDYYHTWYRPDQQAVIVVGDIDPAYIESKIKEIFSPIKMPENPKERVYYPVHDTPGTIYAIGTDKEMQQAVGSLMFKMDNILPREMRNTQIYFPTMYMVRMVNSMLNNRLSDLAKEPDTDYAIANVTLDDFLFSKTKSALDVSAYAKGDDILPGVAEAYRELLRAAKFGFTESEYERARAEFLSQIEKLYNDRNKCESEDYVQEYVNLFIDNEPAPGIEFEKQMYDMLAPAIPVAAINQLLPEILYENGAVRQDNRVFLAMLPDNGKFKVPTEEEVAATLAAIEAEELQPYADDMRTDPLIPALPAAGKIVSEQKLAEWDATEYTLGNGVKVIVKPTDFKEDEIVFEAIAKGNAGSTLDQSKASSIKFIPYADSRRGLNDYSSSDIQKYLAGKQATVSFGYDSYTRELSGITTVKDLPTLMELIYATFTGYNITEKDFQSAQTTFSALLANQEATPEYQFSKYLTDNLFKAPSKDALTKEDILAADRDAIIAMVRGMLSNAADYTFVFTGNIDPATFKPMLEQYIATLPADAANASKSYQVNTDFELALGSATNESSMAMETPQTWAFIGVFAEMPYTAKNKAMTSIAAQILSKRLLNKVREEMGATYSIGAQGAMTRTGKVNTIFQIAFPMKPEMKKEVLDEIHKMVNEMTTEVSDADINPIKEYMVKNANESLSKNDDWTSAMTATSINGVQTFTNAVETLESITDKDVKEFMKEILKQNNYRTIILDPESK